MQTYKRLPININKAEGCYLYDDKGNKYIDFLAGIAVNALGHSHPGIIKAVCDQMNKYMHVSNYFYQKPQIELAEILLKISGYNKVFFTNSGTESIEGALKMTRRWANKNSKYEIISFSGGFHGRTYGALSLMNKPHYKENMGPFLPNIKIIDYNNIDELEKNLNNNTAGIFLEFIQGEGGLRLANPEFIGKIFEMKKELGFLVIADEIQSGVARTGKFFAFDHYKVKPDIITMAKGIGGGLPLGAILVSEKLADIFEPGMHGTTYGGNALSCSAGKVVLKELTDDFLDAVWTKGITLKSSLEDLKNKFPSYIKEIRGIGLMLGLLLSFDASLLVSKLIEHRIITNAASGNVLRLVPPLTITEKEIKSLETALESSLQELISEKKV